MPADPCRPFQHDADKVAYSPVFPMLLGASVQQLGPATSIAAAVPIPCDGQRGSYTSTDGLSSSPVAVLASALSSDGASSDDELIRDNRRGKIHKQQARKLQQKRSCSLAAVHATAPLAMVRCA